jgi:hypothetical protein
MSIKIVALIKNSRNDRFMLPFGVGGLVLRREKKKEEYHTGKIAGAGLCR